MSNKEAVEGEKTNLDDEVEETAVIVQADGCVVANDGFAVNLRRH